MQASRLRDIVGNIVPRFFVSAVLPFRGRCVIKLKMRNETICFGIATCIVQVKLFLSAIFDLHWRHANEFSQKSSRIERSNRLS